MFLPEKGLQERMVLDGPKDEFGQRLDHRPDLRVAGTVSESEWRETDIAQLGEMLPEQRKAFSIPPQDDFVPFVQETLHKRHATAGMAESPIQRCEEELHG